MLYVKVIRYHINKEDASAYLSIDEEVIAEVSSYSLLTDSKSKEVNTVSLRTEFKKYNELFISREEGMNKTVSIYNATTDHQISSLDLMAKEER